MTPVEGSDRDEAAAMELGRMARLLGDPVDEARDAAGRRRWLLAMAGRPRRSRLGLVVLAASLAIAVAVTLIVHRKPAPLEYRVAGPVVADGGWMDVAPAGGPLSVRFSDGTELDLGPGSRGKVDEVSPEGARVVLGGGVLQARVVHRPRARWSVAAGPYTVEVTGTAFDVGWSATSQELELSLHDGSVVVRGPSLPDGLRVAAGQRLVARASTGEATLSSLLAVPPARAETPVPIDAGLLTEGPTSARVAPRPVPSWSEMLADGNFRGVLDGAEARGVDATLSHGSLADVSAFADAARYVHERALAKRGLLAERSRFAKSAEARGAAFVLGSMADDAGSRDEAIRWYDTYLGESPGGPLVAEALGRKLVAVVESGDTTGARAVGQDYLRRFPRGAHAAYARDHVPEL